MIEVVEPYYPDATERHDDPSTRFHEMMQDGARLFEAGRYEEAGAIFHEISLADPANVDARLALAVARFAVGDFREAAAAIRQGVGLFPAVVDTIFDIRDRYGIDRDFDRHLAALEGLVEARHRDIDAHLVLGFVYHFTSQREWSAEVFRHVRKLSIADADLADTFLNALPLVEPESTRIDPDGANEGRRSEQGPGTVVFQGTVSRDFQVAPNEVHTLDGVIVAVEDTDGDPPTADLEIRVGDSKKKYRRVPLFARIPVQGDSDRTRILKVIDIDDRSKTVVFTLSQ